VARPFVTFLSDFGSDDPFVGICQGVILRTGSDRNAGRSAFEAATDASSSARTTAS